MMCSSLSEPLKPLKTDTNSDPRALLHKLEDWCISKSDAMLSVYQDELAKMRLTDPVTLDKFEQYTHSLRNIIKKIEGARRALDHPTSTESSDHDFKNALIRGLPASMDAVKLTIRAVNLIDPTMIIANIRTSIIERRNDGPQPQSAPVQDSSVNQIRGRGRDRWRGRQRGRFQTPNRRFSNRGFRGRAMHFQHHPSSAHVSSIPPSTSSKPPTLEQLQLQPGENADENERKKRRSLGKRQRNL